MESGNGSQSEMTTIAIGREQGEMLVSTAAELGTTVEAVLDEALTEFLRLPENNV